MYQAGDKFTKQVARSFYDVIHMGMIIVTLAIVSLQSNLVDEYSTYIGLAMAFTISKNVTSTLICSVAEIDFYQFTPSVFVFSLGYSSITVDR